MAAKNLVILRTGFAAIAVTALAACGSGASDSPSSTSPGSVAVSASSPTGASSSAPSSPTSSSDASLSSQKATSSSSATRASSAGAPASTSPASGATRSSAASPSDGTSDQSAARHYTATVWGDFTTPSGTQHCQVAGDTASCYLSPAVMAQHGGSNVVLITKDGWQFNSSNLGTDEDGSGSAWAKKGGAAPKMLNGLPVLSYGSSLSVGSYTCRSAATGVTCTNGTAGFTLNSRGATTTGVKDATN